MRDKEINKQSVVSIPLSCEMIFTYKNILRVCMHNGIASMSKHLFMVDHAGCKTAFTFCSLLSSESVWAALNIWSTMSLSVHV